MKKYLVTGLLVWIPLAITVWVLNLIVVTMDHMVSAWLPEQWRLWFGQVPGFGLVVTLIVLVATGVFMSNILGQRLHRMWEQILARIPVVKTIYSGVKQVSDTLFSPGGQAFRKALLIRYPHADCWTIAFQTGSPGGELPRHLHGEYVSVYVPTTPNPTSGFFLMIRRTDVIELSMSVDAALKYVISMGVVSPDA